MSVNYDITTGWQIILGLLIVWELAWKATAMWRAAHNNERGWFVILLVVNSVGVLPIVYLLVRKKTGDSKGGIRKARTNHAKYAE